MSSASETPNKKHTPTPWISAQDSLTDNISLRTKEGRHVADLTTTQHIQLVTDTREERVARWTEVQSNAAFIVRAVNHHENLLRAAKEALANAESWIHDQLDGTSSLNSQLEALEDVRAAIAKAEEAQ